MGTKFPRHHQWTHDGDRVLLVKCVNPDMTSGPEGAFRWPVCGRVKPDKWSREPTCESGGLFGWPWGIGLADGKHLIPGGVWIVFAAAPENVILVDGGPKAKAVPGEDGQLPEVIHVGTMASALKQVEEGRRAWIVQAASSGDYSTAASSGDHSAALATGLMSIAAANGKYVTVEVAADGIAAVWGEVCDWYVHAGAILVQRWEGGWAVLDSAALNLPEGKVCVKRGKIESNPPSTPTA